MQIKTELMRIECERLMRIKPLKRIQFALKAQCERSISGQ